MEQKAQLRQFVEVADGCFRDISRKYLAADGSWEFCEYTPELLTKQVAQQKVVTAIEKCELAGGGWRPGTPHELQALCVYGDAETAVHPELRDKIKPGLHWTGAVDPSSSDLACCVSFNYGSVGWYSRDYGGFAVGVRRVPAGQ